MHQHGVNPAGPDLSYGQPPNQNPQAQPEAAPVKPKEGSFKISDKVFIGIILILAVIVAILGVAKLSNKSTKVELDPKVYGPKCTKKFIHDGYCDDGLNVEECDYDGGDCCYPEVNKKSCVMCFCHETISEHAGYEENECNNIKKGDGFCDGENNNSECEYDDNDCCEVPVKFDFCYAESCRCHTTGEIHVQELANSA